METGYNNRDRYFDTKNIFFFSCRRHFIQQEVKLSRSLVWTVMFTFGRMVVWTVEAFTFFVHQDLSRGTVNGPLPLNHAVPPPWQKFARDHLASGPAPADVDFVVFLYSANDGFRNGVRTHAGIPVYPQDMACMDAFNQPDL